ncbi:hypothetical protein PGT21_023417 [Puccinia graminis f. sp. tritici]|uniref:SET domain-containing protein n=2 Tax=Puccinia graminis f. sp. tritici TaxID=56615 RepID=A0A5B0QC82_PUCGR|nr:hypothetical protein PGT21_023417 [Puccinia graminis f. sp. tritici]
MTSLVSRPWLVSAVVKPLSKNSMSLALHLSSNLILNTQIFKMLHFLLALSSLPYILPMLVGCESINHHAIDLIPSSELHCKKWDSPLPSRLNVANPDYDVSPTIPQMEPFKNGFLKSNCSRNPLDIDPEPFCIFLNTKVNQGMGIVIISKKSVFEASLPKLDFSTELPVPSTIKIVKMPEKGGAGAVASQDLKRGQTVGKVRAVALFPHDQSLWGNEFGKRFYRQAIELLPHRTQDVIASLHATGMEETKEEFIANALKQNTFGTHLNPASPIVYTALVLEPAVRFNHDCRPNVGYYIDHDTQSIHMTAFRQILAGEELTISYRASELTRKMRQDSLSANYGFQCSCSHCQMSSEEGKKSDGRVLRLLQLQNIHSTGVEWLSIEEVTELIKICERENLPYSMINANYIAAQVYNAHGRTQEASDFAKKAKRDGLMYVGPMWKDLEEAQILIDSPQKHNSYLNIIVDDEI